jgi:hypothetical protein
VAQDPDPNNCPICGSSPADGVKMEAAKVPQFLLINCPQCGMFMWYEYDDIFASWRWLDPTLKCALSCATRQASEARQVVQITGTTAIQLAEAHLNTRVSENQERLLREIAKKAVRPHVEVRFSRKSDFTLIDCYSQEEFVWHFDSLKGQGLIGFTLIASDGVVARLSTTGWNRVQPLVRPSGIPGRCFVAMWFSEDTRVAYESGISPAVSDAGFKPIRIDRKEHNNEIPDEIIAEIRNCQFMVADFTGQRAGVYYEAGFAMGLGRAVIWCCRKDEIGKLHFDTNHKNHIDWETPEELRERLYRRIRATILEKA